MTCFHRNMRLFPGVPFIAQWQAVDEHRPATKDEPRESGTKNYAEEYILYTRVYKTKRNCEKLNQNTAMTKQSFQQSFV